MSVSFKTTENKYDKTKVVAIEYQHPTQPDKNFSQSDVKIEVQGTSSQYYPVKNWKLKKLKPNGQKGYVLDTN